MHTPTNMQIGVAVSAAAALAALSVAGGLDALVAAVLIVSFLAAIVAGIVYVNRLTARAEKIKNHVTASGGAPIPPVQPETPKVNHLLHLVLTIITGGFWLLPWLVLSLSVSAQASRAQREYRQALRRYSTDLAAYDHRRFDPPPG